MATCELQDIELVCPDGQGCGIVCDAAGGGPTVALARGEGNCLCFCGDAAPGPCPGTVVNPPEVTQPTVASIAASIAASTQVTASTQVVVVFKDARLRQAAGLLNHVSPYECYVPVSRLEEKVHLSASGTLEEIANQLGLRYERELRYERS